MLRWSPPMKEGIHPRYEKASIICACGNVIETRSTVPTIHVEICSACHPFFTGKQKLADTAGRGDRFQRKDGLKRSGSASTPAFRGRRTPAPRIDRGRETLPPPPCLSRGPPATPS